MKSKDELRVWAKEVRKKYSFCGEKFVEKLIKLKEYQHAKHIMFFYPMSDELNLLLLLNDKTKYFYLPRIEENNIVPCPYKKGDALNISKFKTREPISQAVDKSILDIVIIPALCCDKNNCRLGYGGGFYDRFLVDFKGLKIVCIPKELMVSTIFPENHDIPIDLIIN